MAGEETLELNVKADPETAQEILWNISDIKNVGFEKQNDGTTDVKIEVKPGRDIREKVFFAFAEKKAPILMMQNKRVSLEDVFMELTQNEKEDGKS